MSAAQELVAVATAGGLVVASFGAGRALLAPFCIGPMPAIERRAFELAFGIGVLGWLGFFLGVAGLFQRPWLIVLAALGAAGLQLRTPSAEPSSRAPLDRWSWILVSVLALLALLDLAEAFSQAGCAHVLHSDTMVAPISRTVPTFGSGTVSSEVIAIDRDCRL